MWGFESCFRTYLRHPEALLVRLCACNESRSIITRLEKPYAIAKSRTDSQKGLERPPGILLRVGPDVSHIGYPNGPKRDLSERRTRDAGTRGSVIRKLRGRWGSVSIRREMQLLGTSDHPIPGYPL